nr:MAG TPA: hypothetical protein [Caudoviricetes sp.]
MFTLNAINYTPIIQINYVISQQYLHSRVLFLSSTLFLSNYYINNI